MVQFGFRPKRGQDSLGYASGLSPNTRPPSKSRRVNPALGVSFVLILGLVGAVVVDNVVKKSHHGSSTAAAPNPANMPGTDNGGGANSSSEIASLQAAVPKPLPPPLPPAETNSDGSLRHKHDHGLDQQQAEQSQSVDPVSSIVQQAWVQYVSDTIAQTAAYNDSQHQALQADIAVSESSNQGGSGSPLNRAISAVANVDGSSPAPANPLAGIGANGPGTPGYGGQGETQSGATSSAQAEKSGYLGNLKSNPDYLPNQREAPISNDVMRAGTVIPAVMETGIDSDLPGQILARVSENVYNTPDGSQVLIPQGSELIGTYDNQVANGQSRVLVVWSRIIYPDGSSLDIGTQPGGSPDGYAGFHDQVNNHYLRIFGDAILLSVFSAGVELSQPQASPNGTYSSQQVVAGALGQQLGETGQSLINRDIAIAPTITIRQGYPFDVMITQDFVIKPWEPVATLTNTATDSNSAPNPAPTWVAEPLQDNGLPQTTIPAPPATRDDTVRSAIPGTVIAGRPQEGGSTYIAPAPLPPSAVPATAGGAGIVVQAQKVAPPPPSAPTWVLQPGLLVGQQIQSWGATAGWTVIWNVGQEWPVPGAGATFTGDFPTAAGKVIQDLSDEGATVHATFYQGNHTLVVTSSSGAQ